MNTIKPKVQSPNSSEHSVLSLSAHVDTCQTVNRHVITSSFSSFPILLILSPLLPPPPPYSSSSFLLFLTPPPPFSSSSLHPSSSSSLTSTPLPPSHSFYFLLLLLFLNSFSPLVFPSYSSSLIVNSKIFDEKEFDLGYWLVVERSVVIGSTEKNKQ